MKYAEKAAVIVAVFFVVLGLAASRGFTISASQPHATPRVAALPVIVQDQMFQLLQNLEQEFSIDHTVHWKHSVPHVGDVTTSMSLVPTNFDGCSVVWSQTQEGTVYGQLLYIETRRFQVPLSSIDAKGIAVEPVAAGLSQRPGIESDDYYTVLLKSTSGKNTINMVDHNIVFEEKRGPIASVKQLMVSSAWLRVRQEEQGEKIKIQFQQAISACIAAGQ
ncbi:MAG: hypothetical protein ABSB65_06765 [Candidatus Acidiferrales bacterium]|jgi:hypothetical protein